jgi:hypothetical protein
LGDVGGLQESIYIIGFIIIKFFSKRLFTSSIIKKIYQVKKYENIFDEKDSTQLHGTLG